MFGVLKRFYVYGILGIIVVFALIAFEPTLTSWLFTRTAPPIKVYKAVPLEEIEKSQRQAKPPLSLDPSGGPVLPPVDEKNVPPVTENNEENASSDAPPVSEPFITITDVDLPPPKRTQRRISPEAAAAYQRREASKRLRDIDTEMQVLYPFIKEDRDIHLRVLDLWEERLEIHQERGTLHTKGLSPFVGIKINRLILKATRDGKLPVSIGEELASLYDSNGLHSQAERIRVLTQRAVANGDAFYKPEHMEDD